MLRSAHSFMKFRKSFLRILTVILFTVSTPVSFAVADDCNSTLHRFLNQPVVLTSATKKIFTPESAETLKIMRSLLKKIPESRRPEKMKELYSKMQPEIGQVIAMIDEAEATGYPQKLVATLAQKFSYIIEFPVWTLDQMYDRADLYLKSQTFKTEDYEKILPELDSKYGKGFCEKYAESCASAKRDWMEQVPLTLNDRFPYTSLEGTTYAEYDRTHFFQYQYQFGVGELPMMDFILTRETGKVFIGIKLGPEGNYDGQNSLASGFERHDYLHARAQKVKDQQLFDAFEITNIANAIRLKKLNQQSVVSLMKEFDQISDSRLKATVETLLFAAVHEQSLSYPTQVAADLGDATRTRYRTSLAYAIQTGIFGKEVQTALRGNELEYCEAALQWILVRAEVSAAKVAREFKQGSSIVE